MCSSGGGTHTNRKTSGGRRKYLAENENFTRSVGRLRAEEGGVGEEEEERSWCRVKDQHSALHLPPFASPPPVHR